MTAYEMRISDWSSDVCPSDLVDAIAIQAWRNPFHPLHDQPALRGMQRTAGRTGALVHIEARQRMADAARAEYARHQLRESRQRYGCLALVVAAGCAGIRSEEHTSELQSLIRISYAVFCLKKKKTNTTRFSTAIPHT